MLYIKQEQRYRIAQGDVARTSGEVNYLASLLMNAYFENYDDANDIATEVEFAIQDLYSDSEYKQNNESEFSQELAKIITTADVDVSEIIGALRNAHLEFYFRKVRSYEDMKIAENGDV